MSASLSTVQDTLTKLDILTTPTPTPGDLRFRAAFWRSYGSGLALGEAAAMRLEVNCVAMEHLANGMPRPGATVTTLRRTTKAAAAALPADDFWKKHRIAIQAIIAEHGSHWYLVTGATVLVTLPTKLCTITLVNGRVSRLRRDHRMPAARYWPGEVYPDCMTIDPPAPRYTGPMGDDYPSLVRIREAIADQLAGKAEGLS